MVFLTFSGENKPFRSQLDGFFLLLVEKTSHSAIEIYNETVVDLLNRDSGALRLLDDPEKGTVVEKLTEEVVRNSQHLRSLIATCEDQRQVSETSLNDRSSRSHQIIRLVILTIYQLLPFLLCINGSCEVNGKFHVFHFRIIYHSICAHFHRKLCFTRSHRVGVDGAHEVFLFISTSGPCVYNIQN
ncbi:putative plus-end-directed kinesin ATPase [Helianthus annuus]|nr:putative plus-end-directed kinesin ATPase [Helianthus annuus]